MDIDEEELKQRLTPEQYHSLREKGTEYPGTGALLHNEETGEYTCPVCGNALFKSDTKYESTTPGLIGWPAFSDPANEDSVEMVDDDSMGMHREEIVCKKCGSHLGHFFDDPSSPNGKHYCINSASLEFKSAGQ
jgi:peptide-methionine (R)-S-oxide reductase